MILSKKIISVFIRRYSQSIPLKGIFPPITTTFFLNEDIDVKSLKTNLKNYSNKKFSGIVLFGTNGEYSMLNTKEKEDVLKTVKSIYSKTLIVGIRGESTREAIYQSAIMTNLGADYLLVSPPTIYRANISENDLLKYYIEIADKSLKPILIYNMPAAFTVDISANLVIEASKHPNIVGYKDSGGDVMKLSRIAYETKSKSFSVLAGGAGFLLPSMVGGCSGGITALANVIGDEVVKLYDLIEVGNMREAIELQARMIQPNFLVTRKYGVPGLKYAMELFGYIGGICRSPVGPLLTEGANEIRNSFERNGFI